MRGDGRGRIKIFLGLALAVLGSMAAPLAASPYDVVEIEPVKTSIYVGNVGLTMTPFHRENQTYAADYKAKVFPYLFYNEQGKLWIDFTDADLAALGRGETVQFKGHAENAGHEARRIEGRAVPASPLAGKIKVRVFVSAKIELIFNTTYRFSGK
jgi:hypothetical protein